MVLGALGLMAALLLGLFFFAFFLGVALVAGLALAARGWWLARKGARPGRFPDGRDGHDGQRKGRTLEGEYRVLQGSPGQGAEREADR